MNGPSGAGSAGGGAPGGGAPGVGGSPSRSWGWLLRAAFAVLVRPSLWWVALRQAWRLAPSGWWRRPPYLPLPAPAYLRFRLVTQYGDPDHAPEPADLVSYLRWCRDER